MAKKETVKSFVLRVDAETMEAIEKWAADEFRSTNGQLQWIIAEALRKSGRMKKKRTVAKEYNPQNHPNKFSKRSGLMFSRKLKRSGLF